MKQFVVLILLFLGLFNCEAQPEPTNFSEAALNDQVLGLDGSSKSLSEILDQHKGKTMFIDLWASWCRDCIVGFPKVKKLQDSKSDVVFLFLSLDKTEDSWKKGIDKYELEGEHYFMASGWDGALGNFLKLDWIPRYLVVDDSGAISIYKSIDADDRELKKALR